MAEANKPGEDASDDVAALLETVNLAGEDPKDSMMAVATAKVIKTAEVLNAAETVAALLEKLNPPGEGQDWSLSSLTSAGGMDDILSASVFGVCQHFGFSTSDNDLVQTAVAVLSYAAVMEFAQHCVGVTAGFAKVDFNGERIYLLNTLHMLTIFAFIRHSPGANFK